LRAFLDVRQGPPLFIINALLLLFHRAAVGLDREQLLLHLQRIRRPPRLQFRQMRGFLRLKELFQQRLLGAPLALHRTRKTHAY
jgi:hypothetical protein